jgi:dipeptidyl aminopeptidase/acylaminoacyl peptidase
MSGGVQAMAAGGLRVVQSDAPGLGHLYAPADEGRFPAMLLLHGSEGAGGWLGHREAALFAAHGYLALPMHYSVGDNPWIAGDIWMIPIDETVRIIAALRAHPRCDGRLAVYGWSRGAEHALLAAALMANDASPDRPDAVAAHAPPDRVQGAWRNLFDRREEGEPIQPPPVWGFRGDRLVEGAAAWTWRGQPLVTEAPIPIEAYAGPLFISVGGQDEIWPAEMAPRLVARLRAAGREPEFHTYAGQPHMPDPATWNRHLALLLDFFGRSLG